MKHLIKLLLILTLLPFFSSAQSNYKPGYVVTVKGDTLHGYIDYQEWDSNPTAVSFKSALSDGKPQKLTIRNISFFNVNGLAAYQKFTCSISLDVTNIAHIGTNRDTSFKIDTVFLKILQKGKNVALYSYTDDIKTRFYIGEAPGYAPTELIFRLYENVDANGTTVNENTYLKQLFALANKYNVLDDDLTRVLQTANYSQPDLLVIVSKINNITKAEFLKKYVGRGKINFYVGGAVNIASISSSSVSPYTAGGGGPYTSFRPAVSIGINVIPNPNNGKVEFRGEISLAETQFNSRYQLKVSPFVGVKATYTQLGVSIVPQVIYNFYNAENFKIYVGASVLITHFIYSNTFFGSQNPNVYDNGVGETDPYYFIVNNSSYMLTAGVKINKKFEIFAKYFTITSTTNGGYFQLDTSNEQIGFVYFLGK